VFKLTFTLLTFPLLLPAGTIPSNWLGIVDNSYTNPANWDNGVPINNGANTFAANIASPLNNPVHLGTSATIAELQLGSGNGLTVGSSNNFTVSSQTVVGSGATLQLNSATNASLGNLVNFGTVTSLGTLTFGTSSNNGGTIQLQGGAQMTLPQLNNFISSTPGQVVADASTLTFNSGPVIDGSITGHNGSVLNFNGSFVTSVLTVDTASVLNLNGVTLGSVDIGTTGVASLTATTTNTVTTSLANAGQITATPNSLLLLNAGGAYTNNGTITLGNNALLILSQPGGSGPQTSINGTGTINLQSGSAILSGGNLVLGAGQTVQGQGGIQGGIVVNQGTIHDSGNIFINPTSFTNMGTIVADHVVAIQTLTNYASNTLTGGSYDVTGLLAINNADIHTNQASITLHDSGQIGGFGPDALANFNLNDTGASFAIRGTHVFQAPAGGFTNDGAVSIGAGTLFVMQSGDTYTQNSGSTEVDGQLQAGNVVLNGGTLSGIGQIFGNLQSNGATVAPGDAPGTLTVFGNYIQSATSELDIEFATLTQYSQLNIFGTSAVLEGGTLRFIADPGFNAPMGQIFWILTAAGGLSGGFDSFTTNYFAGSKMFTEVIAGDQIGAMVIPAPEPGLFVLTAIALAIGYRRRPPRVTAGDHRSVLPQSRVPRKSEAVAQQPTKIQ